MKQELQEILKNFALTSDPITILTGAGISAESGIPTFRGPEGYWTIGSKEYHPQEMATYRMFMQKPDEVWKWYLYRMGVCQSAKPNPGHFAIVEMEKIFGDRFTLITQNVDNLHLEAGNSLKKTYQIHGNVFYMRCANECSENIYKIPEKVSAKSKGEDLTETDRELLRCPACGEFSRPHVLWFDEAYNETHYRFHSSLKAAVQTQLLLIIGTSGATNLPNQVVWEVKNHGGILIDINIEENPFSDLAQKSPRGFFIKEPGSHALPLIVKIFKESLNIV
ncbi:MAG: RNA polymerase subunit sigma [Desulfobacterales bacterium]|nr:RNA polymerase subunit sigma [Desulfobacterales bacterium]